MDEVSTSLSEQLRNVQLELKTVYDLLGEIFYIPAYQRGYRWDRRQVTELLEDVFEFLERDTKESGEFYCLQPIVIRKRGAQWEVIDGQQRLTTMLLILLFFNSRFTEEHRKPLYDIEYETRPGSRAYLRNIDASRSSENIDFHHIHDNYEVIKKWFKGHENRINEMESAVLNHVKVIWYEVDSSIDPIAIFSRLNIGKIPLSNAELVKALFLKSSNFNFQDARAAYLSQIQIAQEWNQIERSLQEDDFWYFLSNARMDVNRIERLLELRLHHLPDYQVPSHDGAKVFLSFSRHLSKGEVDFRVEWQGVKRDFLVLQEWVFDREFYHLIGMLVWSGDSIDEIVAMASNTNSKSAFRHDLKKRVARKIFGYRPILRVSDGSLYRKIVDYLAELDYESDRRTIKMVLLVFNIATLLSEKASNARFPFDLFKQQDWDIEHVRSISSSPSGKAAQELWVRNVLEHFTGETGEESQREAIDAVNDEAYRETLFAAVDWKSSDVREPESFEKLFALVRERFDPGADPEADHSIGNLTLLDSSTNRSYKNAIFPIKRKRIIGLDKRGIFVPLCTKNVFLKLYSHRIDNMFVWSATDANDYSDAIARQLAKFFREVEEVE